MSRTLLPYAPACCCLQLTALDCRTRSATKTKCGFSEWPGYESTPPKIYRTLTLTGSLTAQVYGFADCSGLCDAKYTWSFSGSCVYNSDCTQTNTGTRTATEYPDCITAGTPVVVAACDISAEAGFTEAYTSTAHTLTGEGCDGSDSNLSGSASATLSDESSTAGLETDCETALAAASYGSYGSCTGVTALRDLTSNEMTLTLRQVQYRATFSDALPDGYRLRFNYYINGVFQFDQTINLTAGITEYVLTLGFPVTNQQHNYGNFTLELIP